LRGRSSRSRWLSFLRSAGRTRGPSGASSTGWASSARGALVLALVTGIALASHFSLWSSNVLQGKLVVLVLVTALAGLQLLSPATRTIAYAAATGSLLVIWLGIKLTYG
jgi:hypothetical protein